MWMFGTLLDGQQPLGSSQGKSDAAAAADLVIWC